MVPGAQAMKGAVTLMKKVPQKRPARKGPKRTYKRRPFKNAAAKAWRFIGRVPKAAYLLILAAVICLALVEASVANVLHRMATDPITAVILVSSAILASLGVIFGPAAIRSIPARAAGQRTFAWRIVAACFVLSIWNLSTVLANAQAQMEADAVLAAPTFAGDQLRLAALNRRIDAMADEGYEAQRAVATYMAERDLIQARIDAATPRPILFAWENNGWVFWARAGLFHALVAGFSVAFAIAMVKRRTATAKRQKAPADWPFVNGEAAQL